MTGQRLLVSPAVPAGEDSRAAGHSAPCRPAPQVPPGAMREQAPGPPGGGPGAQGMGPSLGQ